MLEILERLKSVVVSIVVGVLLLALLYLNFCNDSLERSLDKSNAKVAQEAAKVDVLQAAISQQNESVKKLGERTEAALQQTEQALKELKPFIEQEERRILGIRSAPKAQSSEEIRQKFIMDARL